MNWELFALAAVMVVAGVILSFRLIVNAVTRWRGWRNARRYRTAYFPAYRPNVRL